MSTAVKRTTLVVRSARRSMAFYRDVLGFTTAFESEITMSGSGYPAGKAGDRIRLAMMQGKASGVKIHSPPHPFTISGPDGRPVQMSSMTILDPNAFIPEINQRPT